MIPMRSQKEKAALFRALHERDRAFILPNPWDPGTARLLERLGFEALATTSAGCAFALGLPDGRVGRALAMDHLVALVRATSLPVSADLENGFGPSPETVAETIGMAAAAGAVGGSIEDATGNPDDPIHAIDAAAARIEAAARAARFLPFRFTLTARAENYLHGRPHLDDTIRRLCAYQAAGADVLYAPGLPSKDEIAAVIRAVDRPLNVLSGVGNAAFTLAELSALGVRRVSTGSALSRTALGAFLSAASEMRNHGAFTFAEKAVPYARINEMLGENTEDAAF